MTAPPTVAYCFLMRAEPPCWAQWWGSYLHGADDCAVYVHSKRPPHSPLAIAHAMPPSELVRTWWGHISLVDATLALFKRALLSPQTHLFCLLSEACVPLRSKQMTHEHLVRLTQAGTLSLLKKTAWSDASSMEPLHEQWCVLTRDAVLQLLQKDFYDELGKSRFIPDEQYMGMVLARAALPWQDTLVTHTLWAGQCHPDSFEASEIDGKWISSRQQSGALFARKVKLSAPPGAAFLAVMSVLRAHPE
jgi:hypothetical protein